MARTTFDPVSALGTITVAAAVVVALAGAAPVAHGDESTDPDVIVLRPVDAQGNLQSGWRQDSSERDVPPIDCSFGEPSPYDVGSSVRWCGGTADSGDACWPSTDSNHVLCVRNPFEQVIDLVSARGLNTPRSEATRPYSPMGLMLDNGLHCRARIGGAGSSPKEHPDWVAYYWCKGATDSEFTSVWAPTSDGNTGITKGKDGWSVMVGPATGHLTSQRVTQVFYVGVAG